MLTVLGVILCVWKQKCCCKNAEPAQPFERSILRLSYRNLRHQEEVEDAVQLVELVGSAGELNEGFVNEGVEAGNPLGVEGIEMQELPQSGGVQMHEGAEPKEALV